MVAAALLIRAGRGGHSRAPSSGSRKAGCSRPSPIGPGGEAVTDNFYFVHQPLTGNGSITAQVPSLRHRTPRHPPGRPRRTSAVPVGQGRDHHQGEHEAGIRLRGGHGHRRQRRSDAVRLHPRRRRHARHGLRGVPALAAADPVRRRDHRLRLGRWQALDRIGTADLAGLPATVQAGLFATSPTLLYESSSFGSGTLRIGTRVVREQLTTSDATRRRAFDHVGLRRRQHGGGGGRGAAARSGFPTGIASSAGLRPGRRKAGVQLHSRPAAPSPSPDPATSRRTDPGSTRSRHHPLGTLAGLIAVIALGAMFITAEYRRGMIRTTFAASPRRGRVLAAKAVVIGAVTFAAGLIGAAIALPIATRKLLRPTGHLRVPGSGR